MKQKFLEWLNIAVYVVIAIDNESDRVKEVQVYLNQQKAYQRQVILNKIYGAKNVTLAPRTILK